jgi:hypothetical protein
MVQPRGSGVEDGPGPDSDVQSELPRLDGLPAADVMAIDGSVFAAALRRLRYEADHPEEVLAGWNSII